MRTFVCGGGSELFLVLVWDGGDQVMVGRGCGFVMSFGVDWLLDSYYDYYGAFLKSYTFTIGTLPTYYN